MAKSKKISFDEYFLNIYQERWGFLKDSLQKENEMTSIEGLLKNYYLDKASLITANILPIKQGDNVLDMCAAPGGKSLVLALKLMGVGNLVCNDISNARRIRLKKVLSEYLPEEFQKNIKVTGFNASRFGLYEQGVYDAILLDTPCSSERHVLNDPTYLSQWSPSRTKHLSIQSFSLLASALSSVKSNGYILYSTCSISPLENDGVIEKLHKKRENQFKIIDINLELGEKTRYGYEIFSDKYNIGPMYFCLIQKL